MSRSAKMSRCYFDFNDMIKTNDTLLSIHTTNDPTERTEASLIEF